MSTFLLYLALFCWPGMTVGNATMTSISLTSGLTGKQLIQALLNFANLQPSVPEYSVRVYVRIRSNISLSICRSTHGNYEYWRNTGSIFGMERWKLRYFSNFLNIFLEVNDQFFVNLDTCLYLPVEVQTTVILAQFGRIRRVRIHLQHSFGNNMYI